MSPHAAWLLLAGCMWLAAAAASCLALHRAQRRADARAQRLAAVIGPAKAAVARLARIDAAPANRRPFLGASLIRLVRYEPRRRDAYPIAPGAIVGAALLLALPLARGAVACAGPAAWAALPLLWPALCRLAFGWCNARLAERLYRQFPDALAMIVRAVRVGLPVLEAVRVVAREAPLPTSREFTILVDQTNIGVPLEDAVRLLAARNLLPEYRFFATALALQSQTGGGLSETLEGLADTIRKRAAAKLRAHALAAEARMSAYILGGLPIVTGVLLTIVNPGYMSVLFTDPTGRMLLLTGVLLLGGGALTMRLLITRSLS